MTSHANVQDPPNEGENIQYSNISNEEIPQKLKTLYAAVVVSQPRCTIVERSESRSAEEFIRQNGFSKPLQLYQIMSWVVYGLDVSSFFLLVIPSVSLVLQIVFGILYGLNAIIVFVFGYIATNIDSIDPFAFREHNIHIEDGRLCDICGPVMDKSKHCRLCNKCVDVFDHHCMWINNCIGKKNYKYFFALLISTSVLVTQLVAYTIWIIVEQAVWNSCGDRFEEAYGWHEDAAFYIFACLIIVGNVPFGGLLIQLLSLHIYLVHHNLTTYDYITLRVEEEVTAKPSLKRHRACAEWIVIDKRRLRRAKKKASNARRLSSEMHESHIEMQASIAEISEVKPYAEG